MGICSRRIGYVDEWRGGEGKNESELVGLVGWPSSEELAPFSFPYVNKEEKKKGRERWGGTP